jgi:hypothetical protein
MNPNLENFIRTLAYAGFVIVFAQLVRYVAKFLGVEQVEKGFQLAKKAVNTIAMAGVAAVGGFALRQFITAGARTGTDENGNPITISSYYHRAAQGIAHIPLVGSKLAMNLYRLEGQVTSRAAEKINKDVELIKNNANALDAYFNQSINALGKMKAIVAKAQAGLTLTDQQMDWYSHYGSSAFADTEDNRIIQKAIPALRNGGNIEIDQLTRRITPILQNREASEKLLGTNIFDYMHRNRPGEFPLFVHQLLENIGSPRQLENLLLSIRFDDRNRVIDYINDAVGGDMSAFLQVRNPNLYDLLTDPNPPPQESMAIRTVQGYFNIH